MNTKNENNSKSVKAIYDITKFTHLDYPGHLACIVWLSGCNMRCLYCYNKDIVFAKNGKYSFNDLLEFLKTRVGRLDGVVLSGGEATTHDLLEFCKKIKKLGFKIKIDTNGTNIQTIKKLVNSGLLDYIALDYKAPKSKFKYITKSDKYDEFVKTLDFILSCGIKFEVRTTLHSDLLNEDDINEIIKDLLKKGYKENYYIQEFIQTDGNIANLDNPERKFDKSKLLDDINVVFR